MANRLLALYAHPVWDEQNPDPGDVLYTNIDDAQGRHLYICGGRNDPAGVVVGDHDQTTGEPAAGLDLTEYNELLPTGNIDNYAPYDAAQLPIWQGAAPRHAQHPEAVVGDPLLPADDQADSVEIRRKYFDDAWAGWGYRFELIYGSDPTNKAIARYLDEDYTQYHYTTGAFVLGDSEWQTDENGDPWQVYYTETPAGFRTAEPENEYLGLWFGQLVAKSPLLLGVDRRIAYYFTHEVGEA